MNWFYHDGALDRAYLRTCAVYRCLSRYGVSNEWAIKKLRERGMCKETARRLVLEIWPQALKHKKWEA